ncbi:Kae1-associated kinase Bud32 [Dictyocaulus viviparus]|uniref:Protein SHQ1 homolog n=1 Tax=Dictyocaulus viviparus TaxID=29172 RepID=A0A0D8XCU6_DICVI|nr:Kae1-associated kinase Bud32 [Dictyocaulus viviparus]
MEKIESEVNFESGFEYEIQDEVVRQGAEARVFFCIYLGKPAIMKERFVKKYRHPALDRQLNKTRMRNELRGLVKARELGICVPAVFFVDDDKNRLIMERIEGCTANSWIQSKRMKDDDCAQSITEVLELGKAIGYSIGKMHLGNLIHGDLTTSNIIVKDGNFRRPFFIDFGLASLGKVCPEDKGVDLYVLERALISTDINSEQLFDSVLQGYREVDIKHGDAVITSINILPDKYNVDAFHLSELLQIIQPQLSIHFNFMIDLDWLIRQYPTSCRESPIFCVVGEKMGTDKRTGANYSLQDVAAHNFKNVSIFGASLPIPFGTHHTKLSIFDCEDKLHVIVSTANLIESDWNEKTQCFYYACGNTDGNRPVSTSEFAADLCTYITEYRIPDVSFWIDRIRNCDFSHVLDRLVFSVPGYHQADRLHKFGHPSLARFLRNRPTPNPDARRLFLAQCSSIGSLGDKSDSWLRPQFSRSLQGDQISYSSRLFLIYPCVEDVRNSLEGYSAGDSLPYQQSTAKRQPWLREIMCKWRSDQWGRTKAMPHVKTYTEIIDGIPQWVLITSANLSKAAWGDLQKNRTQLLVRSYELGVLITDSTRLKLPYDYPVARYSSTDEPWICDTSYLKSDSHGKQWIVTRFFEVCYKTHKSCEQMSSKCSQISNEKDLKVLSYGDVVLYASDLRTLLPEMWLNDNILSFACDYLLSNAPDDIKEQVAIVSAASCELIRYCGEMEVIRGIFDTLDLSNKEKVLFIMNDRNDPTAVGGTHWSLLVLINRQSLFRYYDSMNKSKAPVARQLVNILTPFLDAKQYSFVVEDCAQQYNSFDCGLYVIEFVRHELKVGNTSADCVGPDYMNTQRQHWIDIINSLSSAQRCMITPSFNIVQNDKWLIFTIHAPFAKIAELEIEYGDKIFMFFAPPYYLRVHLTREIEDNDSGTAKYDSTLGEFTIHVPKKNVGEDFPHLDMITELLNPQRNFTARKLVEEISDEEGKDLVENDSQFFIEQKITCISNGLSENPVCGYGFAWRRSEVLGECQLSNEIGGLLDISDPEHSFISERFSQCAQYDIKRFDADRYLLDFMDPDESLLHSIDLTLDLQLYIDANDRTRLKDFPRKKLPVLSGKEHYKVALSLVDIIFAFAYDSRINDWETCCESGWNIVKLSPSLSFLCQYESAKEAIIASVRRSLCYPLYRNWNLSLKVVSDTNTIIQKGRSAILHILCVIYGILIDSGEFRYLFNDLFITDYCLWIQSVDDAILKTLQFELAKIQILKSDLVLDLEELELEGKMAVLKLKQHAEFFINMSKNLYKGYIRLAAQWPKDNFKSTERNLASFLGQEIERQFKCGVPASDMRLCERRYHGSL